MKGFLMKNRSVFERKITFPFTQREKNLSGYNNRISGHIILQIEIFPFFQKNENISSIAKQNFS